MTAPEFAAARRKLGFATQADLANYLGVSRNAVCRWETGVTPVPGPVLRSLKLLALQRVLDS